MVLGIRFIFFNKEIYLQMDIVIITCNEDKQIKDFFIKGVTAVIYNRDKKSCKIFYHNKFEKANLTFTGIISKQAFSQYVKQRNLYIKNKNINIKKINHC